MKPLRVGLIGYDGVQALDIIGPSDAFTIAEIESDNGQRRPCYEVTIVGITNKPFRAESGVSFQPHTTLGNTPTLDTLIIPGGRNGFAGSRRSVPGSMPSLQPACSMAGE
jgi:transcriptional regulator GlxA family with amidase domain